MASTVGDSGTNIQLILTSRKQLVFLLREIYWRVAGLVRVNSLNAFCAEFRQLANLHRFRFAPCVDFQSITFGTGFALRGYESRGRERTDAEDPESDQQTGGFYAQRTNERRKCVRIEGIDRIRSERAPHGFGVKRLNPRGPRRRKVSRALRDGQYQTGELPSLHPRVD